MDITQLKILICNFPLSLNHIHHQCNVSDSYWSGCPILKEAICFLLEFKPVAKSTHKIRHLGARHIFAPQVIKSKKSFPDRCFLKVYMKIQPMKRHNIQCIVATSAWHHMLGFINQKKEITSRNPIAINYYWGEEIISFKISENKHLSNNQWA